MHKPTVYTLENGFRIVVDEIPHAVTVAAGVLLYQGSRHEAEKENGITHFSEHLLFKGTRKYSWKDLSRQMNLLGGNFNAVTSTDWVKLYGTVIQRDLPDALNLLAEMFLHSSFPADEVKRERGVILEEIAMYEDIPEDLCGEYFTQALLLPHPIGRPVIGTEQHVQSFSRGQLYDYWQSVLAPTRMVLTLAGRVTAEEILPLCQQLFGSFKGEPPARLGMTAAPGRSERFAVNRDLEQVNFSFGVTGPRRNQETQFPWGIYDMILGGGMGSRLFDEIREKRGLVYGIGSSVNVMYEAGYLVISGCTRPETATETISVSMDEIAKLAELGPTDEEVDTAKRQMERSILMSQESVGYHASINGERAMYDHPFLTLEEVIDRLHRVTPDAVHEVAKQVANFGPAAACVVGPLDDAKGLVELLTVPGQSLKLLDEE